MAKLIALACNTVSRADRASLQQEAAADSRSERPGTPRSAGCWVHPRREPPRTMMLALRHGQNQ